ncbi:hypothetical protein OQJ19_00645 [Fluoribacter gormanii]|uniref:Uncharacterized protein n=1 Tax=Fluoribacter gormanii TaxID=464 RepID=A0A377GI50_9GAMM|nr:hypothetical protein [Fluoribacter gormanii]KTD03428.1 hypothetical protein Lgor_1413 [Fluoribacter gormanii]MCW8469167.1 hypothetical protein [Fluoribacter gormanii]SIQ49232.1 hypothetical protein SAMN05421777_101151 [Fluoribacter gormanii]STO24456.1 Uncharacterised protein [Fluoribacter gormanii]
MKKHTFASKSLPSSPRKHEPTKLSESKSGPASPRGINVPDSQGEIKVGDPPIAGKSSNEKNVHSEVPAGKGSIAQALKFFRSGKSTSFPILPTDSTNPPASPRATPPETPSNALPAAIPFALSSEAIKIKKKTAKVVEAKEAEEPILKRAESHRTMFGVLSLDNLISEAKHPELYRRTIACTVLAQHYNTYIELLVKSQWHTAGSLKSLHTEKVQKLLKHTQEEQVKLMRALCQILDKALTVYLIETSDDAGQVDKFCEFLRERIDAVMGLTQFDNYPFVKGLSYKDKRHFFPKEINCNLMTMKRIQKKEYELRAEIQTAALDFLQTEKFNEPLAIILPFLTHYVNVYHKQEYVETLAKLSHTIVQVYGYLEELRIMEATFDSAIKNNFTPPGFISFNSLLPEHDEFRRLLVNQISWVLKQKNSKPSCNPSESDFFICDDSELLSTIKMEISFFTKGFKKTAKEVPKDLPKLAKRLAEKMLGVNESLQPEETPDKVESRVLGC